MADQPTTRNQLIEQAAERVAKEIWRHDYRAEPDEDIEDFWRNVMRNTPHVVLARAQVAIRATLEAAADAGLLADPAALLSHLADLTEAAGKERSTEWLRTCSTLPPEEWPPAPGYKGPMVPAAEVEELRAELEEHKAIAARDEASVNRARAERDLALWLHAEQTWWLDQYKHDVTLWKRQVDVAEERELAAERRETLRQDERDALQARIDAVPNILRQHYLAWIECDHDQKMDNPQCACSQVDLGWHPTVGDAVNAWIEHVRAALQGDQPTREADHG